MKNGDDPIKSAYKTAKAIINYTSDGADDKIEKMAEKAFKKSTLHEDLEDTKELYKNIAEKHFVMNLSKLPELLYEVNPKKIPAIGKYSDTIQKCKKAFEVLGMSDIFDASPLSLSKNNPAEAIEATREQQATKLAKHITSESDKNTLSVDDPSKLTAEILKYYKNKPIPTPALLERAKVIVDKNKDIISERDETIKEIEKTIKQNTETPEKNEELIKQTRELRDKNGSNAIVTESKLLDNFDSAKSTIQENLSKQKAVSFSDDKSSTMSTSSEEKSNQQNKGRADAPDIAALTANVKPALARTVSQAKLPPRRDEVAIPTNTISKGDKGR
jgi:hypothetical protein